MTRTYCDRDGTLIPGDVISLTWFNGKRTINSVLCESCYRDFVAWFGKGNPDPEAVAVEATALQSAAVLLAEATPPTPPTPTTVTP